MSGWIKLEKSLHDDPRVLRMASRIRNADVTLGERARAIVLGALAQLWWYADTHIREDDTLDIGKSELDDIVGVPGFSDLIPPDWLEVIDENTIKLPGFQTHNGVEARRRALGAKRASRHRDKSNAEVTQVASPDQDQTKTRPDQEIYSPSDGEFDALKAMYPKRAGDQKWKAARKAINARIAEGATWHELFDGARRYAAFCQATGKIGTEFVKQASTFYGTELNFRLPWDLPTTKADTRQAANVSAFAEAERRIFGAPA